LIAIFLRHSPDSQLFQEQTQMTRAFCLKERVDGSLTLVELGLTPVIKATGNHWLEMTLPLSVASSQHVDEETGCFLVAPPRSSGKR